MSFFKKLKDRLFRSSDKIGEGLDALVGDGDTAAAEVTSSPPELVAETQQTPEPKAAPASTPRTAPVVPDTPDAGQRPGLLGRMLGRSDAPRRVLDDAMLESLEELLIQADMGVETAVRVTANIAEGRFGKRISTPELREALAAEVARIMTPVARPMPLYPTKPQVVLVVGVNGSGKTTTIGKLAARYRAAGRRVVLGAGDTFRAAAIEQLEIWGERTECEVVKGQAGGDPAAVAFDTIKAATARGADVAIIDTAGRLQTKAPLIEELRKIVRVIGKDCPGAPHEVLLVIDANTGQNAISQARIFTEAAGVTGLVLTKLDGTAKGGVLVGLADEFGIPVRYVGVGETAEDLRDFSAEEFVEALFAEDAT
jgi:fused signal recognition particle receptor